MSEEEKQAIEHFKEIINKQSKINHFAGVGKGVGNKKRPSAIKALGLIQKGYFVFKLSNIDSILESLRKFVDFLPNLHKSFVVAGRFELLFLRAIHSPPFVLQ